MAHDVFISYSTKDKLAADAVCARLEGRGIRCWIAPRDILPGMDWGASIIEALESARLMVVVFSSNANASLQIRREVECAFSKEILVVPLRIEDVPPGRSLEYFLGNVHWLDAINPPFEQHLDRIGDTIKVLIARVPAADAETPRQSDTASTPPETASSETKIDEVLARERASAEEAHRAEAAASLDKVRADEESAASRASPPSIAAKTPAGPKYLYRSIAIGSVLISVVLVFAYLLGRNSREDLRGPDATKADELAHQNHARDETAFCANFRDCAEALKELRTRAAQGNAVAQNNLGDMYYYGYGVKPDPAQAFNWYRQAAAQGNAYGQYSLGYLYQNGQGVQRDYSEAVNWYRKAAAQGNADAESHLGDMYYFGYGVPVDYAQSVNWYRRGAVQGNAYAQYGLGYMYQHGEGVERNDAEALNWYRKAAAQGNADAQKMVDQMSASGH